MNQLPEILQRDPNQKRPRGPFIRAEGPRKQFDRADASALTVRADSSALAVRADRPRGPYLWTVGADGPRRWSVRPSARMVRAGSPRGQSVQTARADTRNESSVRPNGTPVMQL